MHIYQQIYEFAASVGAFEGYVYRKPRTEIDIQALSNWADNLYDAYQNLFPDILDEFQSSLDQTLGRAVQSLVLQFDHEHAVIKKLKKMIKGEMPKTPDDFQKQKWFQD
jgi:hypothetical protein